jgi:hypothetical protein
MFDRESRAERAVSEFEEKKQRLFRRDGSRVYGEEEHAERMEALVSELHDAIGHEIEGAEADAAEREQEALALSYTDPTKGLISTDRERLSVSLPLVREDCQAMPLSALIERLKAVAAGSDKVPKVLHARYGNSRAEAEDRRLEELARDGGSVSPEDAGALRELRAAAKELEKQTEDEDVAKRREAAKEAASRSRQLAMKLRRRRSAADGSDERARREYAEHMRSTIYSGVHDG